MVFEISKGKITMVKNPPLGVYKKGKYTVFSVFSEHAKNIELCLFSDDEKTQNRLQMQKDENNIWRASAENIPNGQKYGYRAYGEFDPSKGLYFNPHKLLVDPFAKELSASIVDWENPALALTNNLDSAGIVPKSVVVFDDLQADALKYPYLNKKPHTEWKNTIIYEANVKGFSALHPDLPPEIRGKFLAFAHCNAVSQKISKHLFCSRIRHIGSVTGTPLRRLHRPRHSTDRDTTEIVESAHNLSIA